MIGLAFRLVGREGLADLEQGHVAKAAVGVALRRLHQARQQARAHVGEIRRDRIGQRQPPVAAAEQPGLLPGDERPGDGLHQPAHGERAAGQPRALLDQGQDGLGHHVFQARQGLGLDAVDAGDADDLLDEIGLALDVGPPGRGRDGDALARAVNGEAELPQDLLGFGGLHVETRQARHLGPGELDDALILGHLTRHQGLAGLAAAQVHHHAGGKLQPRHREGRIDAALEAVAGIGDDAELAAGLRDVERVPQGRFDQHVGGGLVAA